MLAILDYLPKLKRSLGLEKLVPDPFLIFVNSPKQPTHSRNSDENKKNLEKVNLNKVHIFCIFFFHKNVTYLILYQLTKFQYQTFPSQYIKQDIFLNSCFVN